MGLTDVSQDVKLRGVKKRFGLRATHAGYLIVGITSKKIFHPVMTMEK